MRYKEVSFTISCPEELLQTARELLADMAGDAGCESFVDTAEGLNGYAQNELFDADALASSIADFPLQDTTISYTVGDAEDKDWNAAWEEEGFEPIFIDDKVIVYDASHTTLNELSSYIGEHHPITIGIDAKLAFGTGTHETTRMIISSLLQMHLEDTRVLDCGCGTGILGIAAAMLGAHEVTAYDIDEWSVENTKHNAELNGINNLSVYHGNSSVLSHISGLYDVVIANINRNILLDDMPRFKEMMSGSATLILSGFYEQDVPMLAEKAKEYGLSIVDKSVENEWCQVSFRASETA